MDEEISAVWTDNGGIRITRDGRRAEYMPPEYVRETLDAMPPEDVENLPAWDAALFVPPDKWEF